MAAEKVTVMVLKVDLQCNSCFKKAKKTLCKFPQIRDQIYNEKANTVTITVVCCSPEKIADKLCCRGGKSIKSIEILDSEKKKEPDNKNEPEKIKIPVMVPKDAGKPPAAEKQRDAGKPKADAGKPKADAGESKPDAGKAKPDAGKAKPDAGKPKEDAGKTKEGNGKQKEGNGKKEGEMLKPILKTKGDGGPPVQGEKQKGGGPGPEPGKNPGMMMNPFPGQGPEPGKNPGMMMMNPVPVQKEKGPDPVLVQGVPSVFPYVGPSYDGYSAGPYYHGYGFPVPAAQPCYEGYYGHEHGGYGYDYGYGRAGHVNRSDMYMTVEEEEPGCSIM